MQYITDNTKLIEEMSRFVAYVQYMNRTKYGVKDNIISFGDTSTFLGDEEYYKTEVAINAHNALKFDKWDESWIGTGNIAAAAMDALRAANKGNKNNLVDKNQISHFRNVLYSSGENGVSFEAEKALFDIYCGKNDEVAFSEAVSVFGGRYDLISFLFFIKDFTKFLPVASANFDEAFKILGIDYGPMSRHCNWGNYKGFIAIISEIQKELREFLPVTETTDIRLIDAHSFVWIIHETPYQEWDPDHEIKSVIEETVESYTQHTVEGTGGKRETLSEAYMRSQKVINETKKRANGICQLCGQPAPFKDKNGKAYLEAHHVDWLSRGGIDSTENTVALCPNCHTKMHVVDDPRDVKFLKDVIKNSK